MMMEEDEEDDYIKMKNILAQELGEQVEEEEDVEEEVEDIEDEEIE